MKKRWVVIEKQVLTRYWEYEVEADTEEEVRKIVKDDNCMVIYPEYYESKSPIEIDKIEEMEE
jgi:hypothetical protein